MTKEWLLMTKESLPITKEIYPMAHESFYIPNEWRSVHPEIGYLLSLTCFQRTPIFFAIKITALSKGCQ